MTVGTTHLTRLETHLDTEYAWLRGELLAQHPNLSTESLRTQQLLGFALVNIAGCPSNEVVAHITDGKDDHGIDAIYFNVNERNLYIFQSKYVKKPANHSPIKEAEAIKFAAGIQELFDLSIFEDGNEKIQALRNEITNVIINAYELDPVPVLVSTSDLDITKTSRKRLDKMLLQAIGNKNALKYMRLSDLYSYISLYGDSSRLDIKLTLNDFRVLATPYNGYYGWLTGETLAELYVQHGSRLFSKNLRSSLGATAINTEISKTARDNPEHFWYYNNGITFLSSNVARSLRGGASADSVDLTMSRGSIVNGAQTTTTLGKLLEQGDIEADTLRRIKCPVRIIEIPDDDDEFAMNVTRFNNSQNSLGNKDFVSLDPFQQELRKRLEQEYAINYIIRSGEEPESIDSSDITLQDATVALVACGNSIEQAVRSKDKISSLWRDTNKPPYTIIFNREVLNALALRKAVYANRYIERFLGSRTTKQMKNSADISANRTWAVATHGNRLFSYYILRGTNIYRDDEPFEQFASQIDALELDDTFLSFVEKAYELFPGSYIGALFKNAQKCSRIIESLPKLSPPII